MLPSKSCCSLSRLAPVACVLAFLLAGCRAMPARQATRSMGSRTSNGADRPAPCALAPGGAAVTSQPRSATQAEMFALVNAYRTAAGCGALRYSDRLEMAAESYARRMFREGFFDHQAPDGSMPSDRAVAAGFCGRMVGENLAYGQNRLACAGDAMAGLKDSPSHNENMLRRDWQYAGIGYFTMSTPRGVEHWWVQLFGRD